MLKKLWILFTFLIFSAVVVYSNSPFINENVYAIKSGKSSGEVVKIVNVPFSEFSGIHTFFVKDYDYNSLLKKYGAKFVCKEEINDICNYYYYSKKLPKVEIVKNKRVNIQISISKETIVVGYPIIYGGY